MLRRLLAWLARTQSPQEIKSPMSAQGGRSSVAFASPVARLLILTSDSGASGHNDGHIADQNQSKSSVRRSSTAKHSIGVRRRRPVGSRFPNPTDAGARGGAGSEPCQLPSALRSRRSFPLEGLRVPHSRWWRRQWSEAPQPPLIPIFPCLYTPFSRFKRGRCQRNARPLAEVP
jgi:hypothetical protein